MTTKCWKSPKTNTANKRVQYYRWGNTSLLFHLYCPLGKFSRQHIDYIFLSPPPPPIFFFFSSENRVWHFMHCLLRMKFQTLFSEGKERKILKQKKEKCSKCRLLKILPRVHLHVACGSAFAPLLSNIKDFEKGPAAFFYPWLRVFICLKNFLVA